MCKKNFKCLRYEFWNQNLGQNNVESTIQIHPNMLVSEQHLLSVPALRLHMNVLQTLLLFHIKAESETQMFLS